MKLNDEIRNDLEADLIGNVCEYECVNILNAAFKGYESINITRRVLDMSDKDDAAIAVKHCGLKTVYEAVKSDEDYNLNECAYYHLEDVSRHTGIAGDLRLEKIERVNNYLCTNLDEVVQATLEFPKDNPKMYSILLPRLMTAISAK